MKYRQWKKNYKKKYGRNPSIIFDRRMQKKAAKRLCIKLLDLNANMISAMHRITTNVVSMSDAMRLFKKVCER